MASGAAARIIAPLLAGVAVSACGAREAPPPAEATLACSGDCLYVDGVAGSDAADGRSPPTAFRSLARAAGVVRPGSTVLVMSGTYTGDGTAPPLTITASGRPDAWITFRAAPGQHPVIQLPRGPGAWAGIHLQGSAYVAIDGFEVVGQNETITAAEAAQNDGSQAFLNELCVFVDGTGRGGTPVAHDVVIRRSSVHHCSGGGIVVAVADAITITENRVHDNAWWTVGGMSGIDLYHLTDVAGRAPDAGYRNVVSGNLVYGNDNRIPWSAGQPVGIYDGNGIIVDDGDHTQPPIGVEDVQGVPYRGRTYVVNNIVHDNGGRGIHVYLSSHVDVVNNTVWNDLLNPSPFIQGAEIDATASSDVHVVNNVAVNLNGKYANASDGGIYLHNAWAGVRVPNREGIGDVFSDPMLADPARGDFAPLPGSPARATGMSGLAPSTDIFGTPRPAEAIDRGAVQVTRRRPPPNPGDAAP